MIKKYYISFILSFIIILGIMGSVNACTDCESPSIKIVAHKIICEDESMLPDWSGTNREIEKDTAQNYVDANEGCELAEGWDFQWRFGGDKPNDNIEYAEGWNNFSGPTDIYGKTIVVIDNATKDTIWLREALKPGYLNFSGTGGSNYTAEFYCDGDVLNYDNYDYIKDEISDGDKFYCVAFNVNLEEEEPEVSPTCSIDSLDEIGGSDEYYFSDSVYISDTGAFLVRGSANVEEPYFISWVGYNRTSPNDNEVYNLPIGSWSDTEGSNLEDWKTDDNDASFVEGWHTVCCKPKASECLSCGEYMSGEPNCTTFCLDKTNPPQVENITHSNPGECVPEYINEAPEFEWDAVEDEGCAGIKHYKVMLYFSDGSYIDEYYVTETNFSVPEEELVNGEDYYIIVRAEDKAGNPGEDSEPSKHVYYDNQDPVVEITDEPWDVWYNRDFYVNETDTDNLGVWKCELAISSNGSSPESYVEVDCNSNHLIDISEYCPEDGENVCWVRKKVTDKACNYDIEGHKWDLDRQSPNTTKTISEPKYPGREWMGWMVDWFVKDTTTISFSCDDFGLSGCNNTYYRINYNQTGWSNWSIYEEAFTLDQGDGIYELEYYSDDNAGNTEEIKSEIDKVDIEAPTTEKSYVGPELWGWRIIPEFELNVWMRFITSNTQIILDAEDSEVGVNKTYWTLLVPANPKFQNVCENVIEEAYINGTWYESWEEEFIDCMEEYDRDYCNITSWVPENDYMNQNCEDPVYEQYAPGNLDSAKWCEYDLEEKINITQDCDHKICYFSEDHLGNREEIHCQVFSVDNQGPEITIYNPTQDIASNMDNCSQSIVATINDLKSDVNESTAYAYLLDSSNEIVEETKLRKTGYGTFDGYMTLHHPEGDYTLKVCANDNLRNENCEEMNMTLVETIKVQYTSPAECKLNPEQGGECDFTYNICMRGGNSIQFWMNKLGGPSGPSPGDMNATISNSNETVVVGLNEDHVTMDGGILQLGEDCETINGLTEFNFHLELSPEHAADLGGVSKIDYVIESSLQPENCNQEEF